MRYYLLILILLFAGQFSECLGETEVVDLNGIHATLDIICLTLPENQQPKSADRPQQAERIVSYTSADSNECEYKDGPPYVDDGYV